jgi:uncharacterized membrane protein YeaQ/YmgE (transglycosylase-associated protein family)
MIEDIAHMGPLLVLAGLMVGWMAEAVSRAGGYGLMGDLGLGLIGSVVAGMTAWIAVSGHAGMATVLLIGAGGALLMIIAQRSLWRSLPLEP